MGLLVVIAAFIVEVVLVNPNPFSLYSKTWHGFFLGLIAFSFGFCFVLSFILFRLTTSISSIVYFQIAFITIFFGMSQGALSMYIPELFPTELSATATGVCFNLGRVITGVAVFFIGSLVEVLGGYGNAIFYFSFVFLIGFIITLFNRQTKYSPKSEHATHPG